MLVRVILLGMMVQLLVIGYVFYQSYKGRQDVVIAQRSGCERAKLDRRANSGGWRIAENARRHSGNIVVADKYESIAEGQEKRSLINCTKAFPNASLLP